LTRRAVREGKEYKRSFEEKKREDSRLFCEALKTVKTFAKVEYIKNKYFNIRI
jgi:hypothetical protein